jgi:hypothetical protein
VSQHMSLCRHYVRQLRRSTLIDTPEAEKAASKRSSAILEQFPESGPSEKFDPTTDGQRISAFLRSDSGSHHSPQNSQDSTRAGASHGEALPRPSFLAHSTPGTGSSPGQYSSSPGQDSSNGPPPTVTREDIRASAERILYQYLIPNAEREIIIPASMLDAIHHAIEEEGRDDPEVFDEAKDYVFQAMQRDAFRDFLYRKGLGNLVPASLMTRMIAGLFFMFAAWWISFTFVFLDEDRNTRCWVSNFSRWHPSAAILTWIRSFFHLLWAFTCSVRINSCLTRSWLWPTSLNTPTSISMKSRNRMSAWFNIVERCGYCYWSLC